jgi:hypothetical protein
VDTIHINVVNHPPTATSAVTQFILFDRDTNQLIFTLQDFDTLNLAELPKHLGIRAKTNGVVGSLVFVVDGHVGVLPRNALTVGAHTLTALPFAAPNGTGAEGASKTLRLFVVDQV